MGGGGKEGERKVKEGGKEKRRLSEIKAVSPVVREEQSSTDSSTSCILVRHLPHLEHDSSPGEVALHFFSICPLEYFIVHLTFAREDNRGRLRGRQKREKVTPRKSASPEMFT